MNCFICKKIIPNNCDCPNIYFGINWDQIEIINEDFDFSNIRLIDSKGILYKKENQCKKNMCVAHEITNKKYYKSNLHYMYSIIYYYNTIKKKNIPLKIKAITIRSKELADDNYKFNKLGKNLIPKYDNKKCFYIVLHPLLLTYCYDFEKIIDQWNTLVKKSNGNLSKCYYYHKNIPINEELAEKLKSFEKWHYYPYAASELKVMSTYWDWMKIFKENWSFRMALLITYKEQIDPIDRDLLNNFELIELEKNNKEFLIEILFSDYSYYKIIADKKLLNEQHLLDNTMDFALLYILDKYKKDIFDERFVKCYMCFWYKFSYNFMKKYFKHNSLQVEEYLAHLTDNTKYFITYVNDIKLLIQKIPKEYELFVAETYPYKYCEYGNNLDIINKLIAESNNDLYFPCGRNKKIMDFTNKDSENFMYYILGKISRNKIKRHSSLEEIINSWDAKKVFYYISNHKKYPNKQHINCITNYFILRTKRFSDEEIEILMPWISKKIIFNYLFRNYKEIIISKIISDNSYHHLAINKELWKGNEDLIKKYIIIHDRVDLFNIYGMDKVFSLTYLKAMGAKKIIRSLFR